MKKLERSRESCVIGGVCGGLGEYFNIDPVIFRIAAVILAFTKGIGVIAYVIAWIAVPRRAEGAVADTTPPKSQLVKFLPGIALILVGVVFLLEDFFYWFSWSHLWPLIVIVVGAVMVLSAMQKREEKEVSERREG
jgi:phage shock protein C